MIHHEDTKNTKNTKTTEKREERHPVLRVLGGKGIST
jgi:hypothetical protein